MSEKADIDFVILWVDDQDPIWIEDKNKYKGQQGNHTNNEVRYRDYLNNINIFICRFLAFSQLYH